MDIPHDWRVSILGDVAETALGKMLDKGQDRGRPRVRYLRNVNVQWHRIDTRDLLTMELRDDERKRFAVEPGDILVCEGGDIGRAAIWQGGNEYIAFQKALHRLRPGDGLDAHFLLYQLEHLVNTGEVARHSTGSTIRHIPQQALRRLPLVIPAMDEQRRIVDTLDDHFSRLDAAQTYLGSAGGRLSALDAAHLETKIWNTSAALRPVGELLAEPMRNGFSAKADTRGKVRVLTLTAVTRREFSNEYTKMTAADPGRVDGLWLRAGDVFVQRSNTPQLVGTAALFEGPADWAVFPDLLIRLRADKGRVEPAYLAAALQSPRSRRELRAKAKGLAGSMPKIDQGAISSLEIPVPALEKQRRIIAALGAVRAKNELLLAEAERSLRGLARVRRALLTAAFTGRLTGHSSDPAALVEMSYT